MDDRRLAYEVILRGPELDPLIRANLLPIKQVFLSMDGLAESIREDDPELMEVVNTLADVLRGVLATWHGVDIAPNSEIGPDEPIDLKHALHVLRVLLPESPPSEVDQSLAQGGPQGIEQRLVLVERVLTECEATMREQGSSDDAAKLRRMKRDVAAVRSGRDSAGGLCAEIGR
jgi:hypothetical protein